MNYEIHVNDKCIGQGERDNCSACPVALAIQSAVPDVRDVSVESTNVQWRIDSTIYFGQLPRPVTAWIMSFDRGWAVSPLKFNLNMEPLR